MIVAGSSSVVITHVLGSVIQGATVGGVARYVRDELEANALFLREEDGGEVLFISCDLGGLEPGISDEMGAAIALRTGVARENIVLGATHTGGPSVIPTNYLKSVDTEYLQTLKRKLVELAALAVEGAVECSVAVCRGRVTIGYNRRSCYADGSHVMGPAGDGFTGVEGPSDDEQVAVFVRDREGEIRGVLHHNTCHPCSFYGADFYSADYPGYARKLVREALGAEVPVVFFNGALGDQGQDKVAPPRFRQTQVRQLVRAGSQLAGETLRLLHEADFREDVQVATCYRELRAAIVLPDTERLATARAVLARVDAGEEVPQFDIVRAHGAALLQRCFGDDPWEHVKLHGVRIGEAAVVTQGMELFCQFGLDIKRRSPFGVTAVFSLCDGYRGYCPTYEAIVGGGYSAEPIYWTRFAPETGYLLVDAASAMLHTLDKERDT